MAEEELTPEDRARLWRVLREEMDATIAAAGGPEMYDMEIFMGLDVANSVREDRELLREAMRLLGQPWSDRHQRLDDRYTNKYGSWEYGDP